jgi:hypothetical protein
MVMLAKTSLMQARSQKMSSGMGTWCVFFCSLYVLSVIVPACYAQRDPFNQSLNQLHSVAQPPEVVGWWLASA